jgi:prepilin-type N-terminal cleavage/methylation domain-containing protein
MQPHSKTRNAGFTLLELLISMGITSIILYTALQMFRDATYSNQVVAQSADMQDNLRAGLNEIQLDLQQAGAGIPTGGISIPYTSNGSTTSPCGTTAPINRPKLGGTTTFPPCNSTLPAVEPGYMLGPPITAPDATAGTPANPTSITDEITVLYQDNTLGLNAAPINSSTCTGGALSYSGSTLKVTFNSTCVNLNPTTTNGISMNVGDLVMFSNNIGYAILVVTGVSGQTLTFASGDAFDLNGRNSDTAGTIEQLETGGASCGGTSASCWPYTTATRIWMITYYLDNITSPPYVRLIRQVNLNSPTPMGETLENLQFTYNFVDGDTNPAGQATVPAGDSEAQIRAIQVYLAARSSYQVHRGNDFAFARNNLMTQISLRSMAFVNKYPTTP